MFDIPDIRDLLRKNNFIICSERKVVDNFYTIGIIIVIYGVLWLLVNLGVIPAIVAAIFPQIVLIIIGLFIIYAAVERKNKYY